MDYRLNSFLNTDSHHSQLQYICTGYDGNQYSENCTYVASFVLRAKSHFSSELTQSVDYTLFIEISKYDFALGSRMN